MKHPRLVLVLLGMVVLVASMAQASELGAGTKADYEAADNFFATAWHYGVESLPIIGLGLFIGGAGVALSGRQGWGAGSMGVGVGAQWAPDLLQGAKKAANAAQAVLPSLPYGWLDTLSSFTLRDIVSEPIFLITLVGMFVLLSRRSATHIATP